MTIRLKADVDVFVEAQARARGVSANAVIIEHVERARLESLAGPWVEGFLAKVLGAEKIRRMPRLLPFWAGRKS